MSAFGQVKTYRPANSSDTLDQHTIAGASYVRTNSATIGVTHTYDPEGYVADRPGVARWVDRSSGIQVGYPWIELQVRRPLQQGPRINRITLVHAIPTLEQTSPSTASGIQPAPLKAYDHIFKGEWLFPERGARWERLAMLTTLISILHQSVNASDDVPTDLTLTPMRSCLLDFDRPY